jgi:hypothetical protein
MDASYRALEVHDLQEPSHSIHKGWEFAIERGSGQRDQGELEKRVLTV